ncbi:unnamed protein product, partial [Laminaria digitata]
GGSAGGKGRLTRVQRGAMARERVRGVAAATRGRSSVRDGGERGYEHNHCEHSDYHHRGYHVVGGHIGDHTGGYSVDDHTGDDIGGDAIDEQGEDQGGEHSYEQGYER